MKTIVSDHHKVSDKRRKCCFLMQAQRISGLIVQSDEGSSKPEESKKLESDNGTAPQSDEGPFKIFVGGLAWDTSEGNLVALLV